jgi:hypothetical protein
VAPALVPRHFYNFQSLIKYLGLGLAKGFFESGSWMFGLIYKNISWILKIKIGFKFLGTKVLRQENFAGFFFVD